MSNWIVWAAYWTSRSVSSVYKFISSLTEKSVRPVSVTALRSRFLIWGWFFHNLSKRLCWIVRPNQYDTGYPRCSMDRLILVFSAADERWELRIHSGELSVHSLYQCVTVWKSKSIPMNDSRTHYKKATKCKLIIFQISKIMEYKILSNSATIMTMHKINADGGITTVLICI